MNRITHNATNLYWILTHSKAKASELPQRRLCVDDLFVARWITQKTVNQFLVEINCIGVVHGLEQEWIDFCGEPEYLFLLILDNCPGIVAIRRYRT